MCTAPFTLPVFWGQGLGWAAQHIVIDFLLQVVAGLLLPSTGQRPFLQPLLRARTEELGSSLGWRPWTLRLFSSRGSVLLTLTG